MQNIVLGPFLQSLARKAQRFFYLLTHRKNKLTLFFYKLAQDYIHTYDDYSFSPKRNGEYKLLKKLGQYFGSKNEQPIVLDVGANVGDWSTKVKEFFPSSMIYCFEPGEEAHQKLIAKASDQLIVTKIGLSDSSGDKSFKVYKNNNSHINSLIIDNTEKDSRGYEIVTISTDTGENWCRENEVNHIHFLKIDVEGAEFKVLNGFEELLKTKKIDIIQFEYGNNSGDAKTLMKDFFVYFEKLGYSLGKITRKNVSFFDSFDYQLNYFDSGPNFLAVRNELTDLKDFLS